MQPLLKPLEQESMVLIEGIWWHPNELKNRTPNTDLKKYQAPSKTLRERQHDLSLAILREQMGSSSAKFKDMVAVLTRQKDCSKVLIHA